ncbi:MAG TPA: FKBP-type peptidyl-prolyl cis-trans isomerase [Limnobacter sp.]|nr:FKBP-type peptidyl-prolyl cis-trans isomerase [Limnobacter sp.]
MAFALCSLVFAANSFAQANTKAPASEDEKTIYALGVQIARSVASFNFSPAELKLLTAGLEDGALGKPAVSLEVYGPKIQTLVQSRQSAQAAKNAALGEVFLSSAAKQKGAVKTASGLVYVPLKEGKGARPTASDVVRVHYRGTLIDGKEFDSSYKRAEPAEFPLNAVIPCWTEGVQTMKVGGKTRLVCPAQLAYGERGTPSIAGGSTLNFEVELLGIIPASPGTKPTK